MDRSGASPARGGGWCCAALVVIGFYAGLYLAGRVLVRAVKELVEGIAS